MSDTVTITLSEPGNQVYSVTELTLHIKGILEADPMLAGVYVAGEVSNLRYHSSGHVYLTLKDTDSVLRAVMFKPSAMKLPFKLIDGMKVIAHGRVTVFGGAGQHQLVMDSLQPDGIGALFLAFEQLKKKLGDEGLFAVSRKKKLPVFPRRIALITSPTGAAVRDMLRILGHRYPLARIRILPVRVQGDEAPGEITDALTFANRYRIAELIICGRGGGSIEDLWAFNDERVARAIAASRIPVISAVGHEPDVTIADFVADVRAATPSNAAELAVPDRTELLAYLRTADARLIRAMNTRLSKTSERLRVLAASRVLQSPENTLQDRRLVLDHKTDRLLSAAQRILAKKRESYLRSVSKLEALSPMKVLARGYAFARDAQGEIVTDADTLQPGDLLKLTLYHGTLLSRVEEIQGDNR
jgi:exodeoxyribonuclease VII large subunit